MDSVSLPSGSLTCFKAYEPESHTSFAVLGSSEGKLFKASSEGKLTEFYSGHDRAVTSVDISANGMYAVSGGADKKVRLWNLINLEQCAVFDGHQGPINAVRFTEKDRGIVSVAEDGKVKRHSAGLATLRGTEQELHSGPVTCLETRGEALFTGCEDGTVRELTESLELA